MCSTNGGLSHLISSRGEGEAGTVEHFVRYINSHFDHAWHVIKAWKAWDKADKAVFNHEWVILKIRGVYVDMCIYASFHRFQEGDVVLKYDSFEDALTDKLARQGTDPKASIVFETAAKRLLMLDYLLPGLTDLSKSRYQLVNNNCQHFAAELCQLVLQAGFYIETCKHWDPVCELELEQKKSHRPHHEALSAWQKAQCQAWLRHFGRFYGLSILFFLPLINIAAASYYTAKGVSNEKRWAKLVHEVADKDYIANVERTRQCQTLHQL